MRAGAPAVTVEACRAAQRLFEVIARRPRVDVATHLLVPYAAALLALGFWARDAQGDRPRAAVAAVFGVAGAAPDADGLFDRLSNVADSLYWMQHRGVSHSLVGAPLFGLALMLLLVLAARWWPRRFGLFAWRRSLVPAAILGSWTHLLLDAVTYGGIPLWWPFAFGRVTTLSFHWLVFWMLPLSGGVLLLHAWGRLDRRAVIVGGAVAVAVLLVLAGFRAATRPDAPEGGFVFPRSSEREWVVLTPLPNGSWRGVLVTPEGERAPHVFHADVPAEAEAAVARARDTDAYRGFLMGAFGPEVVTARLEGGAWNVTFVDVAQRMEALHEPRWTPAQPFDAWGYVSFLVDGDDARATHRGW